MPGHEYDEYTGFADRLADCARRIIRAEFLKPVRILDKHDGSPVTHIDQAVEDELRTLIQSHYPQHGISGEERGDTRLESEFIWILDPVDGTLPLLAGIPVFGTLIALLHHHRPVIGIIDMPVTGERWLGVEGRPTFRNGEAVRVRSCADLATALLSTSNPDYYGDSDRPALQSLREACRWTVYGGSCLAYGRLASGWIDLGIDVQFAIHDYLALVPVIRGAGGVISDWQGAELSFNSGDRIVAAGDHRVRDRALQVLQNLA